MISNAVGDPTKILNGTEGNPDEETTVIEVSEGPHPDCRVVLARFVAFNRGITFII